MQFDVCSPNYSGGLAIYCAIPQSRKKQNIFVKNFSMNARILNAMYHPHAGLDRVIMTLQEFLVSSEILSAFRDDIAGRNILGESYPAWTSPAATEIPYFLT